MKPLDTAEIGNTKLMVTRLGLGGAPIGALSRNGNERVGHETLKRAFELGVRYYDTAPLYGEGASERSFGEYLGSIPRHEFVLSTKVGRVLNDLDPNPALAALPGRAGSTEIVFDFSRDGIMRSVEDSLKRLDLDYIDIALIHDPDDHYKEAIAEAFPTLADLRSQGLVKAIGVGMNQAEMLSLFACEGDFDCFLLAGRYTLLDHSGLTDLLPTCVKKKISVILGGPYNSGILASNLSPETTYFYAPPSAKILERAKRIGAVCDRHKVPLKAAALQFGLGHPAVAATIPGPSTPAEVEENVEMMRFSIPGRLWADLQDEGLIPSEAPHPPVQ